ncbi:DUF1622 domain-containing protein [Sphingomicrobium astaxanthinifaciens]|uniref:DUF1622 domain-containing protein n=1 Tax=Sphingomicrobium astaxanthinifaciens TaxID=1227949 RepID=UPI001FCAD140|nr:DUF1622 domain-containing protein [Sphingomicrobium astaxanthinifaciens]MCJ7420241.1 DUF1622 domain-containing protein [Sphingomicrobium astaxanthinifaciens]
MQWDLLFIMLAEAIEVLGVAVICGGILVAAFFFVRRTLREGATRQAYEALRADLGRGILLGLELLVAADIIFTITAPLSFRSVGLLGLVILIRTFLSFSLETEITGVVPWRRGAASDERSVR